MFPSYGTPGATGSLAQLAELLRRVREEEERPEREITPVLQAAAQPTGAAIGAPPVPATGIMGSPTPPDPLEIQFKELQQRLAQTAAVPIAQEAERQVGGFEDFYNRRVKQRYGGKMGTARLFLEDLTRGFRGESSALNALRTSAEGEWKDALKAAQEQAQANRSAQLTQYQTLQNMLNEKRAARESQIKEWAEISNFVRDGGLLRSATEPHPGDKYALVPSAPYDPPGTVRYFKPPTGRLVSVPGEVAGKDLAGVDTDALGQPINPSAKYRVVRDDRGAVAVAYPVAPDDSVVAGDIVPNADSTQTGYARILRKRTGEIERYELNVLPPAGFVPKTTTSIRFVTTIDGKIVAIPVTSTTAPTFGVGMGRVAPGRPGAAGVGATGTVPTQMAQAQPGQVPATPSSVPTGGRVVGEKPIGIEEKKIMVSATSGLESVAKMREYLAKDRNVLFKAALPGSLGARAFETFRKEAIDVLQRLRTGAAINPREEQFYLSQLPNALDALNEMIEPGAIEQKLQIFERLYSRLASREPFTSGVKPAPPQVAPGVPGPKTKPATPENNPYRKKQ